MVIDKQPGTNATCYVMPPQKENLVWLHLVDLEDWVVVPHKPLLLTPVRGPLGWIKTGSPLPIVAQLCLDGVHVGVPDLKALIQLLGGQVHAGSSKRNLQEQLIGMSLPHNMQEQAREKLESPEEKEWDLDSNMSEILSELEKDDGNVQDLQELKKKEKKKVAVMKMRFKEAQGKPLQAGKKEEERQRKGKRSEGQEKGKALQGAGQREGLDGKDGLEEETRC